MEAEEVTEKSAAHEHVVSHVHIVIQQHGVPFEVEQDVCSECGAVVAERPLKRADG